MLAYLPTAAGSGPSPKTAQPIRLHRNRWQRNAANRQRLASGVHRQCQRLYSTHCDSPTECPEGFEFKILPNATNTLGNPISKRVTLYDAEDKPENNTLFVATPKAENRDNTLVYGITTLLIHRPRNVAHISARFNSLTSMQTPQLTYIKRTPERSEQRPRHDHQERTARAIYRSCLKSPGVGSYSLVRI
ncbi:MAG: hypothetical protein M2R45_03962 [Verrucomicrobia subdivision 3 bacterium]|nr:hypothetical protein [Limisphaerales bacterium]MCS1415518.1 hypothetical protein [Limisphaerales bacterium]